MRSTLIRRNGRKLLLDCLNPSIPHAILVLIPLPPTLNTPSIIIFMRTRLAHIRRTGVLVEFIIMVSIHFVQDLLGGETAVEGA